MPFLLVRIIAVWHRPALPQSEPCSTIGDEGLNFCVRNGNRCNTLSIGASKERLLGAPFRSSKNKKKNCDLQKDPNRALLDVAAFQRCSVSTGTSGKKRRIVLIVGVLALLLFGAFQFFVHTFPGVILQGMYAYYAFKADVELKRVSVDGYEIPYYRGGQGPSLVLVHGFGDSKISFLQSAAELSRHYDVILPDVPGFGETQESPDRSYSIRSQAETLNQFFEKIGLKQFHLVGNSMGGHISAAYTLLFPQKVQTLVLIDAAGLRVDDPVPYKASQAPLRTVEDFDQYISETFARKPWIPQAFKLHFVANSIQNFDWFNRIRQDIREGQDYILNDRVASIQNQTLILWGDSDTVVSPANAQVWSQLLPHSTLIFLDQTGHAPQYERPLDTARIIESFLLQ